jgi:hypothetical protein
MERVNLQENSRQALQLGGRCNKFIVQPLAHEANTVLQPILPECAFLAISHWRSSMQNVGLNKALGRALSPGGSRSQRRPLFKAKLITLSFAWLHTS